MTTSDQYFLQRCIHLAKQGGNRVFPNPQVGAVITHNDQIIGEGFHAKYGGHHAEVAAVNNVHQKELLPTSTIYVSLEPCNHYGKTPPCTELILKYKIPKVFVGCLDPNPRVAGKGMKRLEEAGVEVILNPTPKPFEEINAPFLINQRYKRPYIILKWAQSADRFIAARDRNGKLQPTPITGDEARHWVHKLRARHHGIMVGKNTALIDNPRLNTRSYYGDSPIRLVFDRDLALSKNLKLFTDGATTYVLNQSKNQIEGSIRYLCLTQWQDLNLLMNELYKKGGICSILVEGGTNLLQQFIDQGVYDEIHCLQAPGKYLGSGVKAPKLPEDFMFSSQKNLGEDLLYLKHRHSFI